MNKYNINGSQIKFKISNFHGIQSKEFYENQIFTSLNRIGVSLNFIEIKYIDDLEVQVIWEINKQKYLFKCFSQQSKTKNLGAISQAIQEDIRQITRGIKDLFEVMSQYKTNHKIHKKMGILNYKNTKKTNEKSFSINSIKSDKQENSKLNPKYYYLMKLSDDRLDSYYLKFKEECIKNNSLNHPMLIALKIVRQNKNLKL